LDRPGYSCAGQAWRFLAMARCVTSSDCEGMQVCLHTERCGCSITYGRVGAPECDELSVEAAWALCTSGLMLPTGLLVSLWACFVFVRTVRRRQTGYLLSTTIACLLGGVFDVALWANVLLHAMMPDYPSSTRAWELLVETLSCLHASLVFLAAFNLSLMWVEFVIASRQLRRMGTNLRLTARFLLGFALGFAVFSVLCTILSAVVHQDVKLLWIIATYVSCILLVAVLVVGSRRMSTVLAREAGRSLDVAKELSQVSVARPHLQLSERLRARGSNILYTSSFMIMSCLAYMFLSALYFILQLINAHVGVLWLLLGGCGLSTVCVHIAIINCINRSMQIDAMHAVNSETRHDLLSEASRSGMSVVSREASLEVIVEGGRHSTATDIAAARLSISPSPVRLAVRSLSAPALVALAANSAVQTADSARTAAAARVGATSATRAAGTMEAEQTATATAKTTSMTASTSTSTSTLTSTTRESQRSQTGPRLVSTSAFRSTRAAPCRANRRPDRRVTTAEPAANTPQLRRNQSAFVYTRDALSA